MSASVTIRIPVWLDKICAWPVMEYRKHKYGYPFRKIDLGEREWTMLDAGDYYRLGHFKWYLSGNQNKFYAVRSFKIDPSRTTILRLNREIMNAPAGVLVDHKNGDSLDNRRDNLRLATSSQNSSNKQKRKNTSSQFIGVSFDKNRKKWVVQIDYQGKRIWLGRFVSEIDAAKAYDAAAIKYHGEFARLNFPEAATLS